MTENLPSRGQPVNDVRALNEQARAERSAGEGQRALELYRQIAELQRAAGASMGEAHALRHMADINLDHGELGQARACYEHALDIYRQVGDSHSLDLANAIRGYAIVLGELDDAPGSKARWLEARALYQACGIDAGVNECNQHLGGIDQENDDG
jgi:tetratricopeptide (TPR) repeat protein